MAVTIMATSNGLSATSTFSVTSTPPPPPSSMLVGAALGSVSNLGTAQAILGNLDALRIFYSGGLPANYTDAVAGTNKVAYISYKSAGPNTAGFARSCPAGTRLIYHHEPENDYGPDGSAFVTEFMAQYDVIKAANPKVIVAMAAMSFQYDKNNPAAQRNGLSGTYLPPSAKCDEYLVDDYQPKLTGTSLATKSDFQGWYQLVKNKGKPLGFAEYGRGVNAVGYTADKWTVERPKVITNDAAWLKANPGFNALLAWYWTGSAGDWRFHDSGSVAAFKALG